MKDLYPVLYTYYRLIWWKELAGVLCWIAISFMLVLGAAGGME